MPAADCWAILLQVAFITGGDSGIGRAIAYHYACEGANIGISYWNEHKDAEQIQKACEEQNVETLILPGDISEYDQCKWVYQPPHRTWRLQHSTSRPCFVVRLSQRPENIW